MREKSNKFRRGQGRKKSVALKKDDISWLSKNTHFDPETVTEWHKVRKVFLLNILLLYWNCLLFNNFFASLHPFFLFLKSDLGRFGLRLLNQFKYWQGNQVWGVRTLIYHAIVVCGIMPILTTNCWNANQLAT